MTPRADRYHQHSDLIQVMRLIEQELDCHHKYYRALHVARFLGDIKREQRYAELEAKERERIDRVMKR